MPGLEVPMPRCLSGLLTSKAFFPTSQAQKQKVAWILKSFSVLHIYFLSFEISLERNFQFSSNPFLCWQLVGWRQCQWLQWQSTSRSSESFPGWEFLEEVARVWEGGVLDLCASVGLCQNVGGDDDYIWTMIIMMWMIDLEDDLFRFFSSWEESTLTPTLFWPKSFHWAAWRMPSPMKCMMVWAFS